MIDQQAWRPPYEIVEVPPESVKLLFPTNYFSATIIGDSIQLSISADAASLPAAIERLKVLEALSALGPMPQPVHFSATAQGIEAAEAGETGSDADGLDPKDESPVGEADAP